MAFPLHGAIGDWETIMYGFSLTGGLQDRLDSSLSHYQSSPFGLLPFKP